ncbi:MAG: hypothetical protein ACI4PZ_03335 [Akkermansia sp.]
MNILANIPDTIKTANSISPFFGITVMAILVAGPFSGIFPQKIKEGAKGIAWIVAAVSFFIGLITL